MLNSSFVHLHNHNEYSLLDGFGKAEDYAKRATELGFKYLALTNHGNVDGCIEFQKACDKHGIKPIVGCEIYVCEGMAKGKSKGHNYHMTLLVQNETGWRNLLVLLSYANMEGFYYRPRIGLLDFINLDLKGLIILTGCDNSFLNSESGKRLLLLEFAEKYPVYLEIMPHRLPEQKQLAQILTKLGADYPFIATNDCHYILDGDETAQETLLAIQRKAKWEDKDRFRFDVKGLYLRSADEMADAFRKQEIYPRRVWLNAMRNTLSVAKKCTFRFERKPISLPKQADNPDNTLNEMFNVALERKRAEGYANEYEFDVYKERAQYEFDVIREKGFSDYFLMVEDLVRHCRKVDIMVGPGRGSVGGCLIAFLLGITNIDPLKFNLLFERFINKDRVDYPDIDLDFEDVKREEVRAYLEGKYGKHNVAGLSTFLEMKSRGVIRDVGRVFSLPNRDVDEFAKSLWSKDDKAKLLEEAKRGEMAWFSKKYPKEYALAEKLEQQVRGAGQHAAAIVVSSDDMRDSNKGHLCKRKEHYIINWSMEDAEYMGLMKLDVLGLNTLTVLHETQHLIYEDCGKQIKFEGIDLEDRKVLDFISRGEVAGVFQLSGYATLNVLKQVGVRNFEDIAVVISVSRPGPADSGMTDDYVARRLGAKWDKGNEIYANITRETFGIVVYQEQVMAVISKIAGLPYTTADQIRKVIGKKRDRKEFEPYKEMFVDGCRECKTFGRREAEHFWEGLLEWARYGFNKAHAVAYAMIGYWTAWCKVYYPLPFLCAALTYGKEDAKQPLINEASRAGVQISPPKLWASKATAWNIYEEALYAPFTAIKGIGEKRAEECVKLGNPSGEGFFTREELSTLGMKSKSDSGINELLHAAGVFVADTNISPGILTFELPEATETKILRSQRGIIKFHNGYIYDTAKCTKCHLRRECQAPVLSSPGTFNISILGEAPGPSEDKEGMGFFGQAGELLWEKLRIFGYEREMFHVCNVCACYPSVTKTPKTMHINACFPHVKRELKEIECRLILALGNTPYAAITGKTGGITKAHGTTTWEDGVDAWVCWGVHPAYTLRGNSLKEFEHGIENFVDKIRLLRRLKKSKG